jgi:hypothetical protein
MADQVYRVRTEYKADTKDAESKIGRLGQTISSMGSGVMRVGGALASMARGALIPVGLVTAGLGVLAHGLIGVGAQAESTGIAIAGMLQAGGATSSFTSAMQLSQSLMAKIRSDAAKLPGEAEDFVTIFRASMARGMEAGWDPAKFAALSNQVGAVGITMGIDAPQIGRDLNAMLGGHAGAQVRTWGALQANIAAAGQELHLAAGDASAFNKLRPEDRIRVIETAIGKYGDMVKAFAETWDAQSGTFKSNMFEIFKTGTAPLFEFARKNLVDINKWFDANAEPIQNLFRGIGTALANGLERAKARMESLFGRMREFGESDTFKAISGALSGAGSTVRAVVDNAGGAGGLAQIAGRLLGAGGPAGMLIGGGVNFATEHQAEFSATMNGLMDLFTRLGALVMPLLDIFGQFNSLVGGMMAGILPGLVSGLGTLADGVVYAFNGVYWIVSDILGAVGPAVMGLAGAIGTLLASIGGVLGPVINILGGLLMEVWASVREYVIPAFNGLISAITSVINWIAEKLSMFGVEVSRMAPGGIQMGGGQPSSGPGANELMQRLMASISQPARAQNAEGGAAAQANRRRTGAAGKGSTNVTVRLEQTIHDASDPDRVMIQTRDLIRSALEHPISSSSTVASVLR